MLDPAAPPPSAEGRARGTALFAAPRVFPSATLFAALCAAAAPAAAQPTDADDVPGADPPAADAVPASAERDAAPLNQLGNVPAVAGFEPDEHLLGGAFGREALADAGLRIGGALFLDGLGVVDGPDERAELRNLGVLDAAVDTGLAGWWDHGTAFARVYAGAASDGAAGFPATLQEVDTVPAFEHVVLGELWYEHRFPDARTRVRFGRMDANTDFAFAPAAAALVTDSAAVTPTNYGIPSYLDPALGLVAFAYPGNWSLGAGVYRGTLALPTEAGLGELEFVDVRLDGPDVSTYAIGKVGRRWELGGGDGRSGSAWSGEAKLGGWLADSRFRRLDGERGERITGGYLIVQQLLHGNGAGGAGPTVFAQLGLTDEDFSPVADQLAAGLVWNALVPGRPDDTTAFYASRAGLSDAPGNTSPRDAEWVLELTHTFRITPSVRLQPDLQHVIDAGGEDGDVTLGVLRAVIDF